VAAVADSDRQTADRRRQQSELYGASVDVLTQRIGQHIGLQPRDVARTIGVSFPMFTEVLAGRRVRIGNPVAISRLGMLRDFAGTLESGESDRADIELTLAQIRASTLAPGPGLTTPAQRRSGSGLPSGTPSERHSASSPSPLPLDRPTLDHARELVSRHVRPTPTRRWPMLEAITGTETWVKHENNNPTGAFKVRGGLRYVSRLRSTEPTLVGLIAATRGNHGQSIAFAGSALGVPVTIVAPESNSPDKNAAMRALGADLVLHGHDFQESVEHAKLLAADRGLTMVPSFHRWLVEGVATYAAELHESVIGLDTIYVPVGMGSGICANIAVRDLFGVRTEIVGVVSELAPAYALSYDARRPVSTPTADTFVDGVACRTPDPDAVAIIAGGAARIVRVSEAQVAEAMAIMYRTTHNLAEPAGATALAGLLAEKDRAAGHKVAVIHTGGNCDFSILDRVMKEFP
jgi:threonine dehydratase